MCGISEFWFLQLGNTRKLSWMRQQSPRRVRGLSLLNALASGHVVNTRELVLCDGG